MKVNHNKGNERTDQFKKFLKFGSKVFNEVWQKNYFLQHSFSGMTYFQGLKLHANVTSIFAGH